MADAHLTRSPSRQFPLLIMGGAGFSFQLHQDPKSLPAVAILKRAFDLGLKAIDTSPYYEPSEEILGEALSAPEITAQYRRSDYLLMTKVGRIAADKFDYSQKWIEKSLVRSLARLKTSYLDVVFCHDVEFVSINEAVEAIGTLFRLSKTGHIKQVGISGYDIERLATVAIEARERYGRSVDVVQNWGQLTLQNTRLEKVGFEVFKKAGVSTVCNSSPLGSGLLRKGGVPLGALGDWHPAPPPLRAAAQEAAEWVESEGDTLAALAVRFTIAKAMQASDDTFQVSTIIGVGAMSDLEENVQTAKKILRLRDRSNSETATKEESLELFEILDEDAVARDTPLYDHVQRLMGDWLDYDFSGGGKK